MPILDYFANRLRLTVSILGLLLTAIVANELVLRAANQGAELDVWIGLSHGVIGSFFWGSMPWLLTRILGDPHRRFVVVLFFGVGVAGSIIGQVQYWTAGNQELSLIHFGSAAFIIGSLLLIPTKEPRVPPKYHSPLRLVSSILAAAVSIGTAYLVLMDLADIATTAFAVEYSLWTATLAIGYWNHYFAHSAAWCVYALAFRTILQSENKFPTLLVCLTLFIALLLQGPNARWMPSLPVAAGAVAIQFILLVRLFAIDLNRTGIDLGSFNTPSRPSAISVD